MRRPLTNREPSGTMLDVRRKPFPIRQWIGAESCW
jgi:hypothetical protein